MKRATPALCAALAACGVPDPLSLERPFECREINECRGHLDALLVVEAKPAEWVVVKLDGRAPRVLTDYEDSDCPSCPGPDAELDTCRTLVPGEKVRIWSPEGDNDLRAGVRQCKADFEIDCTLNVDRNPTICDPTPLP